MAIKNKSKKVSKVKLPSNAHGVTRGKRINTEVMVQNPADTREELIIKQAKRDFASSESHWNEFREKASDCLNYLSSDYLRADYMANRESSGMPCLTENRVPAFHETVVNQLKQNQPAIQIDSASEQTDPKFAEQMADSIRTIEQDSHADVARGNAAWYAIGTGMGFTRIINEYVGDNDFKQKMRIIPVEDPSTVYPDPNHKCVVGSDQEYCLVVEDIPIDTYVRKYATGKMTDFLLASRVHGFDAKTQKQSAGWITENNIRVAEYYVKEWFTKKIYLVWDKSIGAQKVVEADDRGDMEEIDSREVKYAVIKYYVLNDKEILKEDIWPGQFIPVPIYKGIEFWNKTKRHLKGMIDDMRDPQRRLDFTINWQAEMMMLAAKAPYIGTAENFEDNQDDWANMNLSNIAYVTYKPSQLNQGRPPARDVSEVPINSSQQVYVNAVEGIKAVTGMQAPLVQNTLGEAPNTSESGIALQTRIQQGHDSTFHFQDHIRQATAHEGQLLIDAFPTFYGENGRQLVGTKQNGEQYQAMFNSTDKNMLDSAKFKVRVETGPAYATKQQENQDRGLELMRTDPQVAPLIQDLVAGQGQGQYWKLIAARLRAGVPPQILAATEDMDKQEDPQALANAKTQVASLQQQLQKMQAEVEPDKQKIQILEMKLLMETNDNKYDLEKTKLEHTRETDKVAFEKEKLGIEKEKVRIDEQKIILEGEVKRKELALEEREIAIKEKEFQLKVNVAIADIQDTTMEHHHKVHENETERLAAENTEPKVSESGAEGDMNDLS
jgi:hypothetical protein